MTIPIRSCARSLTILLTVALAGCGGGGGGGGGTLDTAPTLVSVTFLGNGATPVAGDTLRLLHSEPVTLVAGRILDDSDLDLSSGTLGAIVAPPTLISPLLVEVTLGAGVVLVPGTTTIQFSAADNTGMGSDAIVDSGGRSAVPGAPRTLKKADGDQPTITSLTLNAIDSILNGTGPAGGTLQVFDTGATIDLAYTEITSAIDTALTVVSASVQVKVDGNTVPVGENLVSHLTASAGASNAGYFVPANVSFPQGSVTITCYVVDTTGRLSDAVTFAFLSKTRSDQLRPFETSANASQVWFLNVDRDVESYTVNLVNGSTPVQLTSGANSRSDLEDLFRVIGLQAATPIPNVSGTKDSNEVVMDLFKARVLTEMASLYPQINVTFTFASPGAFPGNQFVLYNNGSFSQLCLTGSADGVGSSGVLGLAIFDPHNETQEDDCAVDFQGRRLGVFLHTLINNGFLSASTSTFRMTFDTFTPARAGTPIGADGSDGGRLLGTLTPPPDQRELDIQTAINRLARVTAVVAAHECGHSMGLVPDNPMPTGLYGGPSASFPGSQSGHLVMPASIFPGTSFNVMSPSIGFLGALDPGTRFNTLNLAYLREAVVYN